MILYCKKNVFQFTVLLLLIGHVFSQEKETESKFRIGLNNITPIMLKGSDFDQDWFDRTLESSLSSITRLTKKSGWGKEFQVISSNDKIIQERQKKIEELKDCSDAECSFELGKILIARYMLSRTIEFVPPKQFGRSGPVQMGSQVDNYDITIEIIDIKTSELIANKSDIIELKSNLSRKKKGDALKSSITSYIGQMFEEAFDDQPVLFLSSNTSSVKQSSREINIPKVKDLVKNIKHDTRLNINLEAEDIDNDIFQFTITQPPTNGSIRLTNNRLVYEPFKGFEGRDAIKYIARDTDGYNSNTGTITIRVTNSIPIAFKQNVTLQENERKFIELKASDGEDGTNLTYIVRQNPQNGSLKRINRTKNQFYYTPNNGYSGYDQFVFEVIDSGKKISEPGIVDLEIIPNKKVVYNPPPSFDYTDNRNPKKEDKEGGLNMMTILGGLLIIVLLAAAGGGGGGDDAGGGSPTGGVDIGITIP